MNYVPLNYEAINIAAGTYSPSLVRSYNNKTFAFWERALFQRACSVLEFELPTEWQGSVKDFFYYCLFKFGYVAVFDSAEFGLAFQPCTLNNYDFYYQPVNAQVSNPKLSKTFTIGDDCELIKLCPDYRGIFDIIQYYAEKLSSLDNSINMSIINSKYALLMGAKTKNAIEALKKMTDKINRGEPAVLLDMKLLNDEDDKDSPDPFKFYEMELKKNYLLTDLLQDFQTIMNHFDTEIGIPTLPYQKKERMVTSEAESKVIDATSRSVVWFDTIKSSLALVNAHFGTDIDVKLRYKMLEADEEVSADE